MGWSSSLLGSNIVSDYTHIDNLRNDITAGKVWDSGETKYVKTGHGGVNGYITTSSGVLLFSSNSGAIRITENEDFSGGYIKFDHDGTYGHIDTSAGELLLMANSSDKGKVRIGGSGTRSRLYMYDTTLAAWRYIYVDNGVVVVGT